MSSSSENSSSEEEGEGNSPKRQKLRDWKLDFIEFLEKPESEQIMDEDADLLEDEYLEKLCVTSSEADRSLIDRIFNLLGEHERYRMTEPRLDISSSTGWQRGQQLPYLTRLLEHPPKSFLELDFHLTIECQSILEFIPDKVASFDSFTITCTQERGASTRVTYRQSLPYVLYCCRNVKDLMLERVHACGVVLEDHEGDSNNRSVPPAFQSQTEYLHFTRCTFDANPEVLNPASTFPKLKGLNFGDFLLGDDVNARAFWKQWFEKARRTLTGLTLSFRHYDEDRDRTANAPNILRTFSAFMAEATHPDRTISRLQNLTLSNVDTCLLPFEFMARTDIRTSLKSLTIEECHLDSEISPVFMSFSNLKSLRISGEVPESRSSSYSRFFAQYLPVATSLKHFTVALANPPACILDLIPYHSLRTLDFSSSHLFANPRATFPQVLQNGSSIHTLRFYDDSLHHSVVVAALKLFRDTLQSARFDCITFADTAPEEITKQVLKSTTLRDVCLCFGDLSDHNRGETKARETIKKADIICQTHCLTNKARYIFSQPNGRPKISRNYLPEIIARGQYEAGPDGVYALLQGFILRELGLV